VYLLIKVPYVMTILDAQMIIVFLLLETVYISKEIVVMSLMPVTMLIVTITLKSINNVLNNQLLVLLPVITLTACYINFTSNDGTLTNYSGCYNQTFDCTFSFFGIIAGIAGAIIGGVLAAAACILAGASLAGGAYAVSSSTHNQQETSVSDNPLYKKQGREGRGLGIDNH